jgi:ATP-dependent DNA helicase RecQ
VEAVLDALPATTRQVSSVVNLGTSRIDAMLKVLDVEGAVTRAGTTWERAPGLDAWTYDGERYAAVTELRRAEQAAMAKLGADGRCLMRSLQEELDDPEPRDCGRCSVCTQPKWDGPLDQALIRKAALHLRDRPIAFDAKKMAPDADGAMKKIPEDAQASEGRSLARFGDGGWDPLVQAGPPWDAELLDAAAELVRHWGPGVQWVAAVPPHADLGRALAERLGLPFLDLLARTQQRPPQTEMANAATQAANVRGAFAVTAEVPASAGLLVDDVRRSGWTVAMVAGQLRRRGATAVHPLVLATAY